MIMPDKNTPLANSLLGYGAIILQNLHSNQTISSLWEKVSSQDSYFTFEKYCLALDVLFAVRLIQYNHGVVIKSS